MFVEQPLASPGSANKCMLCSEASVKCGCDGGGGDVGDDDGGGGGGD